MHGQTHIKFLQSNTWIHFSEGLSILQICMLSHVDLGKQDPEYRPWAGEANYERQVAVMVCGEREEF